MYEGDRSRKLTLVEHGFRLPSALDNRPLRFDEFEQRVPQFVYVSATPGDYELRVSEQVVEQIIRPTGLVDPEIVVRPTKGQIDDLVARGASEQRRARRARARHHAHQEDGRGPHRLPVRAGHRACATCTPTSATLERVEILRDLRAGVFDCLVGINLLREGLDLPEVSLVAILDADKEGFLRNFRSLIQTIGRAARNVSGQVIMYADKVTDSMRLAIDETNRRRAIQVAYNTEHGIEPQTIRKAIADIVQYVHEGETSSTTAAEAARELAEAAARRGHAAHLHARGGHDARRPRRSTSRRAARLRDQVVQAARRGRVDARRTRCSPG